MAEPTADDLPVLLAVHNGLLNLTDETAQFVERSYLVPPQYVSEVISLLAEYQVGPDNFIDVPMGGRPDGV